MSPNISFEEIKHAREILGMPEKATIRGIKELYRRLCRQNHPDLHPGEITAYEEKMKAINLSYRIIMEYCNDYPIRFTEKATVDITNPEDLWLKQFGNDPIWGPGNK
jgi:hypothetical protein